MTARASRLGGAADQVVGLEVNGVPLEVPRGTSVACAVLNAGTAIDLDGASPWTPLCGMGICWGCRATIDGRTNRRSCLIPVADGMRVQIGDVTGSGGPL